MENRENNLHKDHTTEMQRTTMKLTVVSNDGTWRGGGLWGETLYIHCHSRMVVGFAELSFYSLLQRMDWGRKWLELKVIYKRYQ